MTTIIARETEDGTEWGWDSQVTIGSRAEDLEYTKVFRNGDLIIGMSGRLSDSQTVRYMNFPEVDTWDVDRWVTKVFTKKLAKKEIYANIILEVEGRLYDVGSGDAWTRNTAGLYTIGSGGDLAFGALATGVSVMDALEVAAEWDTYTGGLLTVQTGERILSEW